MKILCIKMHEMELKQCLGRNVSNAVFMLTKTSSLNLVDLASHFKVRANKDCRKEEIIQVKAEIN